MNEILIISEPVFYLKLLVETVCRMIESPLEKTRPERTKTASQATQNEDLGGKLDIVKSAASNRAQWGGINRGISMASNCRISAGVHRCPTKTETTKRKVVQWHWQ